VLTTVKVRPGSAGGCRTLGTTADLDGGCARLAECDRKVGTKERPPNRTKELGLCSGAGD